MSNNFGLSESVINKLLQVFSKYNLIDKVIIFGSRANGLYQDNSDIDLAIIGNFDNYYLGNLKLDLEELNTPFLFDIVNFNEIDSFELKQHINQYGQIMCYNLHN